MAMLIDRDIRKLVLGQNHDIRYPACTGASRVARQA
jgi:hypothetical protein